VLHRVVLLSRAMLAMQYNFYLPLSMVDENMRRASLKDAAISQRFYVRKTALTANTEAIPVVREDDVCELTVDEFINGSAEGFPGVIPAVLGYLETLGCDSVTRGRLLPYLNLIQKRASGELPTTAHWMRRFITSHAEYAGDGKLTSKIADDLVKLCDDIGMGRVSRPDLLGDVYIRPLSCESPYDDTSFCSPATAKCSPIATYRPKSFCEGGTMSVLYGSGPQPDTYLDSRFP
jgi:glutamate--cysteine ligase catalytic subunit